MEVIRLVLEFCFGIKNHDVRSVRCAGKAPHLWN